MKILAWFVLVLAFLNAIAAPSQQGKAVIKTSAYTVVTFIEFLIDLAICGRVIGWW